jgi:flavin-dependent dehydrogenase
MRRVDVAIVGGGPAGWAVSIEAARRGLSTLVIERQSLPVDKACGEGLMPSGWRALEELGATAFLPPTALGRFDGIRYLQENGSSVTARFKRGHGTGIRRLALSQALQQAATGQGVEILSGTVARDIRPGAENVTLVAGDEAIEAKLLIAADGLTSPLRKQHGLEGPARETKRFGLRRHFRGVPTSGFVDVHWAPGAEAYVTPLGDDRCGVAFLFNARRFEAATFESLLTLFPALASQLDGAPFDSAPRGAGPLGRRVPTPVHGRLVLIGDAAGAVDAITGEGLTLAFESAKMLGAELPEAIRRPSDPRPLARYVRRHAALLRRPTFATQSLVWLAERPRLRRAVFDLCVRLPFLFEGTVRQLVERT